jgi:alpha-glucosidase (family GH31 glycosyl hydrolase)
MGGATEPELYARWVQFGALSPCLRLHSTKDPRAERRPWGYPPDVDHAARAAFRLRYQLVPYLYSMARVAADTGVALCRPMYYEHPEKDAAYAARYQYYLGDQAIAAPIVWAANPETGFAATDVWLPEGTWIDYQTHETYAGPRWVRLVGDLERVPLLIRAGGILPLAPQFGEQAPPRMASGTTDALPQDWLVLSVYPGSSGRFRLYEDDGVSNDYQAGQFEWTEFRTTLEDERT